jgi:hypothetical protein
VLNRRRPQGERRTAESFKIVGIRGFGTMYALIASAGNRL